jgi:type II secretory pathway pseudopilin PulG
VFYGAVAVLLALLILASSLTLYYYGQNQQSASQNQRYVGELDTALASYRSLSGSFNASLSDYARTLALLGSAVASLNTSTPAYVNASLALSSLWNSYQQLSSTIGKRALTYSVHLLIDFGNGTLRWYNDTSIQPGWNGYVATLVLLKGNVQAVWYPQYGEHFVTGVDGVPQRSTASWFFWDHSGGQWALAQTGADGLRVNNGTSIAWTLCGYDANFNPSCSP